MVDWFIDGLAYHHCFNQIRGHLEFVKFWEISNWKMGQNWLLVEGIQFLLSINLVFYLFHCCFLGERNVRFSFWYFHVLISQLLKRYEGWDGFHFNWWRSHFRVIKWKNITRFHFLDVQLFIIPCFEREKRWFFWEFIMNKNML